MSRLPSPDGRTPSASNLKGDSAPKLVLSAYRREFTVLAVKRDTYACSIRPAPLFERRIVEPGALSQDFSNALVADLAGVHAVLVCLMDLGHAHILAEQRFLGDRQTGSLNNERRNRLTFWQILFVKSSLYLTDIYRRPHDANRVVANQTVGMLN